jgi:hypothetical protein
MRSWQDVGVDHPRNHVPSLLDEEAQASLGPVSHEDAVLNSECQVVNFTPDRFKIAAGRQQSQDAANCQSFGFHRSNEPIKSSSHVLFSGL